MSATTTGVAAALMSVPVPQIREAANAAAADARLAMTDVCSEMRLQTSFVLAVRLGVGGLHHLSLARRTFEGRSRPGPPGARRAARRDQARGMPFDPSREANSRLGESGIRDTHRARRLGCRQ
jgi:hypothetical protein